MPAGQPDQDTAPQAPQIYLATPAQFELTEFSDLLAGLLDRFAIACVRLSLGPAEEAVLLRNADHLREVVQARDVPLVIDTHFRLAGKLGLDGVHLTDGPRQVKAARAALDKDAIVGAFCGTSRHVGMTAGELGADYVSFGPITASSLLADGSEAEIELFEWWSQMIEVPVVAEGGLTEARIAGLASCADFLCFGPEVWEHPDGPEAALAAVARQIG